MDATHHEVPYHQVHQSHIANGVSVVGGTNWDLARTAVVTPITQYARPAPAPQAVLDIAQDLAYQAQIGLPVDASALEMTFKPGQRSLTKPQRDGLAVIPKGYQAIVAAYATKQEGKAVATARAQQVANELRRRGVTVHGTKTFDANAGLERRVEVYFGPTN